MLIEQHADPKTLYSPTLSLYFKKDIPFQMPVFPKEHIETPADPENSKFFIPQNSESMAEETEDILSQSDIEVFCFSDPS